MSESVELELESLRFSLKRIESELAITKTELESQRRASVRFAFALKREVSKTQSSALASARSPPNVPSLPGIKDENRSQASNDQIDDTLTRDDLLWHKLRVEYLSLLDELTRTKSCLTESDSALRQERERRLGDIENLKLQLTQKDNEILNFKTSFDALMKRSVELEDCLAKAKESSLHRGSVCTTAAESTRSSSPPPQFTNADVFSRNFSQPNTHFATMNRLPLQMGSHGSSPLQTSIPMYSPVMMSRQVLPSPIQPQQVVRRYADGRKQ